MKILFSGGGTMGPVSPLIAIFQEVKKRDPQASFFWLATKQGPEAKVLKEYGIDFKQIFSGKLRRYFSWHNFIDHFLVVFGFFQALFFIYKFKPDVIISAGGYVALPVNWAGWFLRKKVIIHQLDVKPTLTNKLSVWCSSLITTSFESSLENFPKKKTKYIGTPIRQELFSANKEEAISFFNLERDLPTLLVVGGGTGAFHLNKLVSESIEKLTEFCQVIHVTGGRSQEVINNPRYHAFDFLIEKMKDGYAVADLVVTRAGLGALSELSALGKAIIIIPMPGTHQEKNVIPFIKNNAALKLDQLSINPELFTSAVKELINDKDSLDYISENIKKITPNNAAEKFVDLLYE